VQKDLGIDLPDERDELSTGASARFAKLRSDIYRQIQVAKIGGFSA
jgi:NitT/TauT family transport system ATP-binding protein